MTIKPVACILYYWFWGFTILRCNWWTSST